MVINLALPNLFQFKVGIRQLSKIIAQELIPDPRILLVKHSVKLVFQIQAFR